MTYIPQLIPIYAQNDVADIKNRPELLEVPLGMSLEALAKQQGFTAEQKFVEKLKRAIEDDREHYEVADRVKQIVACLKSLMQIALYDEDAASTVSLKIETKQKLFAAIYGGGWSPEQRKHFDFVAARLRCWLTYFISYTNAGATIVNDDYEGVILKFSDPKVRKTRNPEEDNLLVDAMVNWLGRKQISRRSFYDRKKIEAGDIITHEVRVAVRDALAFVQLVSLDAWDKKKKINWPFEEYRLFDRFTRVHLRHNERYRMVFETRFIPVLVADPDKVKLDDDKIAERFRQWKKRIFGSDEAGLPRYLRLPSDKQAFEAVMEELENAIVRRACRIIESVPA